MFLRLVQYFLLGILFVCPVVSSWAQQPLKFTRFSPEDGYVPAIVTHIHQNGDGLIWIGTADGLFSFDGYQFKEYRRRDDDPESLANNVVVGITSDASNNLWIATEGGGVCYYEYATGMFKQLPIDPKNEQALPSADVTAILVDKNGEIWAGTHSEGIIHYQPATGQFKRYQHIPGNTESLGNFEVDWLMEDTDGNIWVGLEGGGINIINRENAHIEHYIHDDSNPNSLPNNEVKSIIQDSKKRIWVGTRDGLCKWNPANKSFEQIGHRNPCLLSSQSIRDLAEGPDGRLWIATLAGLNILDVESDRLEVYQNDENDPESISNNFVSTLYKDNQGLLWVGTWGGDLNRVDFQKNAFNFWGENENPQLGLASSDVKAIYEDHQSWLWVGTDGDGVSIVDRKTGSVRHLNEGNGLSHNLIYSITGNEEGVWIGTSSGINFFHYSSEKLYRYLPDPNDPEALPNRIVWALEFDLKGRLWVGTGDGLGLLENYEAGAAFKLKVFKEAAANPHAISSSSIRAIHTAKDGNLWVGTERGGLNFLDIEKMEFSAFKKKTQNDYSIPDDYIFSISEDAKGHIWVGTGLGAYQLNQENGKFHRVSEKDGLPNDFVFGIEEDELGQVWMSTNRGLFKYKPEDLSGNRVYDILDGLQDNEFNQGANFKNPRTNEIFFGGIGGVNSIVPGQFKKNEYPPPVIITELIYYNRDAPNEPIALKGINALDHIKLSYKDDIIDLSFAALNYIHPEKNEYRYKFTGFNEEWIERKNKNKERFTNLRPGKYTLHVQGSNNDRIWNEEGKKLDILITPPWYQTTVAYIGFFILAFVLILAVYNFQLNRKLQLQETKRLKELDELKTKFFTNIAHEFRTPLTVILGMINSLPSGTKAKTLIERNSYNMLNLVNQMLDLRKLEAGKLPVNLVQADIVAYLKYVLDSFGSFAEKKDVKLHFLKGVEECYMDFDPDKVLRIFSNLISNAIKYNKEGGNVYCQVDGVVKEGKQVFCIKVKDTGIGIAEKDLNQIFERFYQVNNDRDRKKTGTGIGLALTKELVKYFDGKIEVTSEVDKGTTFEILLPIKKEALLTNIGKVSNLYLNQIVASMTKTTIQSSTLSPVLGEELTIQVLIIEDNADVAEYLSTCLQPYYRVSTAVDGEEGIRKAKAEIPDIIISDVMMPQKDGYEVLEALKNDETTSHIPMVMLTAKSDFESRIVGLQKGADVYLAKPFHQEELLLHLKNLLQAREKLQLHYQKILKTQIAEAEQEVKKDPFIEKVMQSLEKKIGDEQFGILELCRELGVSRTQLHNKLKALTGLSTSHFINSVRLRKGQQLLLSTQLSVSEVAYSVGYKEPTYFSRLYQEHFGISPSKTRKLL